VFAHRVSADPIPSEKAEIAYLHKQMAIRLILFEVYSARKSPRQTRKAHSGQSQSCLWISIKLHSGMKDKLQRITLHII